MEYTDLKSNNCAAYRFLSGIRRLTDRSNGRRGRGVNFPDTPAGPNREHCRAAHCQHASTRRSSGHRWHDGVTARFAQNRTLNLVAIALSGGSAAAAPEDDQEEPASLVH
jgi:hypothetical protein